MQIMAIRALIIVAILLGHSSARAAAAAAYWFESVAKLLRSHAIAYSR